MRRNSPRSTPTETASDPPASLIEAARRAYRATHLAVAEAKRRTTD